MELFFQKEGPIQKQILHKILSDQRSKDIIPQYIEAMASKQGGDTTLIDITDPSNVRPIDNTAFHWHVPGYLGVGRHRSYDENNNLRQNFNLGVASYKSLYLYATKIKDFIMGLPLTDEQRRSALWKSFTLPGMSCMIKSYGLTTNSMNVGLIIACNIQRFMQYARSTNSQKGRASDAQRIAVNAITAGAMATPPPKRRDGHTNNSSVGCDNNSNNLLSKRKVLKFLGLPQGSHHILKKCGKFRRAAKEGLDTAFDFLGPRRSWKKVSLEVWEQFRNEWLPNSPNVTDVPSKGEAVLLRDIEGKLVKDEDNKTVLIQKRVSRVCLREIHNEMLMDSEEGGFDGARDGNGDVVISETAMRRNWPNWIVRMAKRFKAMCG